MDEGEREKSSTVSSRSKLPAVEALRVLGALLVFFYYFLGDYGREVVRIGDSVFLQWGAHRSGDFAVAMFVILGGVVSAWASAAGQGYIASVKHRLSRLFRTYWCVAVPLIALALIAGRLGFRDIWKVPVWLSGLGVASPATFFPVVDAWWYMSLAVQLALVGPLVSRFSGGRHRLSGILLLCCAISLISVIWFQGSERTSYLVMGLFTSRIWEFVAGFTIGRLIDKNGTLSGVAAQKTQNRLNVSTLVVTALVACFVQSNVFIPRAAAVAIVFGFLVVFGRWNGNGFGARLARQGGALSFIFYLSHSPWDKPVLGLLKRFGITNLYICALVCLAVAVAVALSFNALVSMANAALTNVRQHEDAVAA